MKSLHTHLFFFIVFLGLFAQGGRVSGQAQAIQRLDSARLHDTENLNVFQQWIRWNNGGSLLMNYMTKNAFELYDKRVEEIAKLKSRQDWEARQREVKSKLMQIIGPFPAKTALNPAVTGVIKKDGYQIEKIVFESMPGFYVTGCLYVPSKVRGKVPAVLNLIGHEQESFRAVLDQVVATNLVKKGMVVFTIDPLGQGEHLQYFDTKVNFSAIGYSVIEHCYFGNQCFLSGVSSARYFVWDAMRALDYLATRKEVDMNRIGVTGFSGGGTITSYMGALDDRVKVAIPSSWSNASHRQLETKGAQDAEATLVRSVANRITFEDLLEVRAPRPTLLTFTSRDEYLSMQGAREAYAEAMKAYEAFGEAEKLQLVEDDSKHWLTPKIREAIYSFFMKHLDVKGDPTETDVEILTQADLTVTRTGQIATTYGGNMVFDVNKIETGKLINGLETSRKEIESHLATVPSKAITISGYRKPVPETKEPFINGRYQRDGYSVTKYAVRGDGQYVIPVLLFLPDDNITQHPAIIYLHPGGKVVDAKQGGKIEELVKAGNIVAAVDVLGIGETENTASRGLADGYTGVLTGQSVVAIQAADIARVALYLKTNKQVDASRIGAVAFDKMCIPLIHAAAFETSINGIALINPLISYRSVAMNRHYKIGITVNPGGGYHHPYEVDFSWGIAGVLSGYDLPDLLGVIAPRKIMIINPMDQMLEPAAPDVLDRDLAFPKSAYQFRNAPTAMRVIQAADKAASTTAQLQWILE